jgi:hypothetical protein
VFEASEDSGADLHMAVIVPAGADSGLCVVLGTGIHNGGDMCVTVFFVTLCFVTAVRVRQTVQTSAIERWI